VDTGGSLLSPEKFIAHLEKCIGHSLKNLGSSHKLFASRVSQAGYGSDHYTYAQMAWRQPFRKSEISLDTGICILFSHKSVKADVNLEQGKDSAIANGLIKPIHMFPMKCFK